MAPIPAVEALGSALWLFTWSRPSQAPAALTSASAITRAISTSWWKPRGVAAPDDVDVGLREPRVAALLRPLAPPHLLDLVATERELQLAGVLEDVARERHRQVEVQADPGVRAGLVRVGSFDEVMMMAKAIDRGSKFGLRMVDMPYWSFTSPKKQAVENAGRFVHEANAEVMKCEA